jgi:amino acid transporter
MDMRKDALNETDKEKLARSRFTRSIILFSISIVLFWIAWLTYFFSWQYYKYTLFNIAFASLLLIAVLIIVFGIVLFCRKKSVEKEKNNPVKKVLFTLGLVAFIGFHVCWLLSPACSGYYAPGGMYSILSKDYDSSSKSYYFTIHYDYPRLPDSIKIKCSQEVYETLIVGEEVRYHIQYRTVDLRPGIGFLYAIDYAYSSLNPTDDLLNKYPPNHPDPPWDNRPNNSADTPPDNPER